MDEIKQILQHVGKGVGQVLRVLDEFFEVLRQALKPMHATATGLAVAIAVWFPQGVALGYSHGDQVEAPSRGAPESSNCQPAAAIGAIQDPRFEPAMRAPSPPDLRGHPELISAAVAVGRFEVCHRTLYRAIQSGTLTDHRLPGGSRNQKLRLDVAELGRTWPERQHPQRQKR